MCTNKPESTLFMHLPQFAKVNDCHSNTLKRTTSIPASAKWRRVNHGGGVSSTWATICMRFLNTCFCSFGPRWVVGLEKATKRRYLLFFAQWFFRVGNGSVCLGMGHWASEFRNTSTNYFLITSDYIRGIYNTNIFETMSEQRPLNIRNRLT